MYKYFKIKDYFVFSGSLKLYNQKYNIYKKKSNTLGQYSQSCLLDKALKMVNLQLHLHHPGN